MDFETWFETLGINVAGYSSISFKVNVDDLQGYDPQRFCLALQSYVSENCQCEQMFMTAGLHENGKNEIPHYHVNFAVFGFKNTSNESRRRKQYLEKTWGKTFEGLECKIREIQTISNLEDCLKYPYKEKKTLTVSHMFGFTTIPREVVMYMMESAYALFLGQQANQRKKDRSSDRVKTILEQIDDLVRERDFTSYQQFKEFVAREYFTPLELHEMPDMANFKKQLEKVAVKRGIVPPHYFL